MLDEKDLRILEILQENSKITMKELSRKIGSPITTTHSRVRKLEKEGYIRAYRAILDAKKLGIHTSAFILISFTKNMGIDQRKLAKEISLFPEVQEVHIITGDWDILLKIKVKDVDELGKFVVDKLRQIHGVEKTYTSVVLDTIKETTKIKLSQV
ncbi:MAG: Lrp/AsnC family transcriptional regulator [Thermoprotei archaeon]|nr:MAG: Lrp/AsnC family transcriptional regulator [Thermoprotei archaeon]